jgi:hypothetical protein
MPLRFLLILAGGIASLALALPAAAAPDNKNVGSFEATCEGLGAVTVTEVQSGQGGGASFLANGQVAVAKSISGSGQTTLTVENGPTLTFPDQFEVAGHGGGYEGRLTSCDFTQSFEFQFQLNRKGLRDLQLGDEFLGATVTGTSTFSGTAQVLFPGN